MRIEKWGMAAMVYLWPIPIIAIPFIPWLRVYPAMWVGFGFWLITALGITVSYHREITHQAIKLRPWIKYIMAFFALLSLQGMIKDWTTEHRRHHKHVDAEGDPHSPHFPYGGSVWTGFLHAHFGWLFLKDVHDYENIPDILLDKGFRKLDNLFPFIVVLTFLLPGLITLLFVPSFQGFATGVFWGGIVRVFVVHHLTWLVNSWGHLWGSRPWKTGDYSTNNFVLGVLTMGEGFHNNHHGFEYSARLGLKWWEIDGGWYLIKLLDVLGQVEHIRLPLKRDMIAKAH